MKLHMLIALIFAFTINFGACMHSRHFHSRSSIFLDSTVNDEDRDFGCADGLIQAIAAKFEHFCAGGSSSKQPPIKKNVAFADSATIHMMPSESSGMFWVNKKELLELYQQKAQIFTDQNSSEFYVLDMIAGIIEKSHLIFEKIYRFTVKIDGYELCLSQAKVEIDAETSVDFPDTETFTKLEKNKEYFNELANDLLALMKPSYEMNERLFKLMKNMDATTKIDPNLCKKIEREAVKMNFYVQDLTNRITKCRLDLYVHYLNDIRIQTNHLECEMITLDDAKKMLEQDIKHFRKLSTSINKTLKLAMRNDFEKLQEIKGNFCDLVKRALLRMP